MSERARLLLRRPPGGGIERKAGHVGVGGRDQLGRPRRARGEEHHRDVVGVPGDGSRRVVLASLQIGRGLAPAAGAGRAVLGRRGEEAGRAQFVHVPCQLAVRGTRGKQEGDTAGLLHPEVGDGELGPCPRVVAQPDHVAGPHSELRQAAGQPVGACLPIRVGQAGNAVHGQRRPRSEQAGRGPQQVWDQDRRRHAIATTTRRLPVNGRRPCPTSMLSMTSRSPACHGTEHESFQAVERIVSRSSSAISVPSPNSACWG